MRVLTDEHIPQSRQTFPELLDCAFVCLDLLALRILAAALLFCMKAQILKQNHLATCCIVDRLFNLFPNAIGGECDILAQQLLELWNNRLQTVLGIGFAIWPTKMRHENDSFGSMVDGVLDGGDSTDNTLVVGDLLVRV
jgi:hypothetical protein